MNTVKPQLLIVILTLGVFCIINTEMGVVGMVPQIAEHFNVSVPQAGMTVSVFALMVAVSAPVMPLLCSRFNRKHTMVVIMALFTLSTLVAAFTTDFWVLLVMRALPALLHPVFVSQAFTTVAAAVPPEQGPRAISRVFIGVSAGMVLGVPVTSYIAVNVSYQAAMLSFTACSLLVLIAMICLVPSIPAQRQTIGSQLAVLKAPPLWYGLSAYTLVNGAIFGFFSFMTDFLNRVSGLSFDAAAAVLLAYGLCNILGNLLAGRVYFKRRAFYLIAVPALSFAVYAALFVTGSSSAAACVLIALAGIIAGFMVIPGQHMISSAAGQAQDFANGLFLTAANFGTMAGTALCGYCINSGGTRAALWGTFIFFALSFVFLLLRLNSRIGFLPESSQAAERARQPRRPRKDVNCLTAKAG